MNDRGLIVLDDSVIYAFVEDRFRDFPFSEVIPHPVGSSKYEGSAERWGRNEDKLCWVLAKIDLNDLNSLGIYNALDKWKIGDFTIEDWELILKRINLISLNSGRENLPQELIYLINKKENPGGFWGTARWGTDNISYARSAANRINDFYSKYNAWKQASLRTVNRRKEILKTCNDSFLGRLEIQV